MIRIRSILAELIATPTRCFVWALFMILLGGSLASPFIVVRERHDSAGLPLLSEDGTPVMEVDTLANILAHWPENLCILSAVLFMALGLYVWLGRFRGSQRHKGESNKGQQ